MPSNNMPPASPLVRFRHYLSGQATHIYLPLLINLLIVLSGYMICRMAFYLENRALLGSIALPDAWSILRGGLRYDLSTFCYTNALYVLLAVIMSQLKARRGMSRFLKILFAAVNGIGWASCLADAAYYPYIGRRVTASVFAEFQNDNLSDIFLTELLHHWYFVLLGVALVCGCWLLYRPLRKDASATSRRSVRILATTGQTLLCALLLATGIRGGVSGEVRPLSNREAQAYVSRPVLTSVVINTPFSIIRTMGRSSYPKLQYFTTERLDNIYSPIHQPAQHTINKQNIVILLLESFGSEYSAYLNPNSNGVGYMPFLDSLMTRSLTCEVSLANGRKSIDAQASVWASIPMLADHFMTSQASLNNFEGIATHLRDMGYQTAFFHGADNGSLNIDGFSRACGFEQFHGRTEYNNDNDYDHWWGIWDEPFMQYFGRQISQMQEPFMAGIFTLSSHHPFHIPQEYSSTLKGGPLDIHRCIQYTDIAVRHFFDYAQQQPWYANTLFVITGDHTNQTADDYFRTDLGLFCVPIIFYHPSDSTFRGVYHGAAGHIDIMPTLLGYVGYDHSYLAFGKDLLNDTTCWTVNYSNGQYQYIRPDRMIQFDGQQATACYDLHSDSMLRHNLCGQMTHRDSDDLQVLQAVVQQYMTRMNENRLVASDQQASR